MTQNTNLKAIFLLGTLKHKGTFSHTDALCEVVAEVFKEEHGVESEIIWLSDLNIPVGLKSNMGKGDDWPKVLEKMFAADIIIFATPIWWGIQSSLIQRSIERLDELNDELLDTGKSEFNNKVGGVLITGSEDGVQHVVGNILNFMSWNGFTIAPAPSVSWLGDASEDTKESLKKRFKKEGSVLSMTRAFVTNSVHIAKLLKGSPIPTSDNTTHQEGAIGFKENNRGK